MGLKTPRLHPQSVRGSTGALKGQSSYSSSSISPQSRDVTSTMALEIANITSWPAQYRWSLIGRDKCRPSYLRRAQGCWPHRSDMFLRPWSNHLATQRTTLAIAKRPHDTIVRFCHIHARNDNTRHSGKSTLTRSHHILPSFPSPRPVRRPGDDRFGHHHRLVWSKILSCPPMPHHAQARQITIIVKLSPRPISWSSSPCRHPGIVARHDGAVSPI